MEQQLFKALVFAICVPYSILTAVAIACAVWRFICGLSLDTLLAGTNLLAQTILTDLFLPHHSGSMFSKEQQLRMCGAR